MSIGDTIKSLRQERGYSQKELAEILNLSPGCLSKYENDKVQIPNGILISVANVFDVSLDYLLGRTSFQYPISSLNDSFYNNIKMHTFVNDSLKLSKPYRKTLCDVLKALKCECQLDSMKSPK